MARGGVKDSERRVPELSRSRRIPVIFVFVVKCGIGRKRERSGNPPRRLDHVLLASGTTTPSPEAGSSSLVVLSVASPGCLTSGQYCHSECSTHSRFGINAPGHLDLYTRFLKSWEHRIPLQVSVLIIL